MSNRNPNTDEMSKDIVSENKQDCVHDWKEFHPAKGYGEKIRECRNCGMEEWDEDLGNIYY